MTTELLKTSVTNIKIGGEYRYEIFRVRVGYAKQGDPYKANFDNIDIDRSRTTFSGGIGVNMGKYFFDMSVSNTKFDQSFRSYRLAEIETSPLSIINHNITSTQLTFGLNF
jgi:hypothetical protein